MLSLGSHCWTDLIPEELVIYKKYIYFATLNIMNIKILNECIDKICFYYAPFYPEESLTLGGSRRPFPSHHIWTNTFCKVYSTDIIIFERTWANVIIFWFFVLIFSPIFWIFAVYGQFCKGAWPIHLSSADLSKKIQNICFHGWKQLNISKFYEINPDYVSLQNSEETRPCILCVPHQMSSKKRKDLVGWWYWLVLDGTGSVNGDTCWYLVELATGSL